MRKALLTGTAAVAIGLFGFGANSASALSFNLHNIPVAVGVSHSTANAANNGSNANSGTQVAVSHNNVPIAAASECGGCAAASQGSNANTGLQHSLNGAAIDSTVGSYNGGASTGSGGGVAAGPDGFAFQANGSFNHLDPGSILSNGSLSATNSFNKVHVDVTLADASAGGHFGDVTINNQNPDDPEHMGGFHYGFGNHVSNEARGNVGITTQIANGMGFIQNNQSVAIGAVNSGATLVSR